MEVLPGLQSGEELVVLLVEKRRRLAIGLLVVLFQDPAVEVEENSFCAWSCVEEKARSEVGKDADLFLPARVGARIRGLPDAFLELRQQLRCPSLRIILHDGLAHSACNFPPGLLVQHGALGELQTDMDGVCDSVFVVRIHDQCVEELLCGASRLRKNDGAGHHVLHSFILRGDELLRHQIHAVNQRGNQTTIRSSVQRRQFVDRHASMDIHNGLVVDCRKATVDHADGAVHLLLDVPILLDVLSRRNGDEEEDSARVVQGLLFLTCEVCEVEVTDQPPK
mmetsp:Transcript_38033/g.109384  ORF Transcript_38033/g.109384 Transcript_38033/m.109384 type:complete len:280 (-) Transcript_38033:1556-2395(-)